MTQVPVITQAHFEAAFEQHGYHTDLLTIMNTCNQIALAEQEALENAANESINQLVDQDMQDQFITAEEAARLGPSNVEVLLSNGEWYVIHGDYLYPSWNKYRAIRKEVPAEPTCQVRNLDTGELKTMTREAAQKLQAETNDACNWYSPHHTKPFDVDGFISEFIQEGIYTYCSKAKKPVSWKDAPVGVMTNKGELRGVYLAGDNTYRICTESKHRDGDTNWSRYVASFVELAPADQQPWIPVIAPHEGLIVEYSKFVECLRVVGIADGWELK